MDAWALTTSNVLLSSFRNIPEAMSRFAGPDSSSSFSLGGSGDSFRNESKTRKGVTKKVSRLNSDHGSSKLKVKPMPCSVIEYYVSLKLYNLWHLKKERRIAAAAGNH